MLNNTIGTTQNAILLAPPQKQLGDVGSLLEITTDGSCPSVASKVDNRILFYPPPVFGGSSSSSTGTQIQYTSPGPQMAGTYPFVAGCISSKSCCCGAGVLTVSTTTVTSAPTTDSFPNSITTSPWGFVRVNSPVDGGIGCLGLPDLSTVMFTFAITSPFTAAFQFGNTFR